MPNLVVIFGPPASGKAAVGYELSKLTDYSFFHNHLTADPAAALFGWGTERFSQSVDGIRRYLFSKAANDPSLRGVIFTFVWGLDLPAEGEFMEETARTFTNTGGHVFFVELLASLETRVAREGTPFRMGLKPAQRDVEAARACQYDIQQRRRLNTDGDFPLGYPHLVLDTELLSPEEAARQIAHEFGLADNGSASFAQSNPDC